MEYTDPDIGAWHIQAAYAVWTRELAIDAIANTTDPSDDVSPAVRAIEEEIGEALLDEILAAIRSGEKYSLRTIREWIAAGKVPHREAS
ncbi:hypothetical protein [Chelatococcus asaccharovorans]|uniref:hypothetical protein n=1 Tax=Chelatococcus asaccharovorans TaxID=28210 RepID=UPI002263F360|nr:hypothetical protein [Chelatococcus asaccharovorans]